MSANPLGYQQILAAAVDAGTGLTPPTGGPQRPTYCLIVPEGQAIRWRDDGTNPSATVGQPLAVGQVLSYDGNMNTFRAISQVAGAILNVTYYYGNRQPV